MKLFKRWLKSWGGDEVDRKVVEGGSELITVFIGISIILLGSINAIKPVPEEFIIGATLSGLFFAASDYFLIKRRFYIRDLYINMVLIFFGVLSFFLLPVALMTFPNLQDNIKGMADLATFVALGLILSGLGFKSYYHKRRFYDSISTEIFNAKRDLREEMEKSLLIHKELEKSQKQIELLQKEISKIE